MKPKKTESPEEVAEVVTPDAVEVTSEEATPKVETPSAIDYSKYAAMAQTPTITEWRKFDSLTLNGTVETEVVGDGVEKRKPAIFYKSYQTRPKLSDGKSESDRIPAPITVVPIQYRVVMQQTTDKGKTLVLKSSEFNGNPTDKVIIFKYGQKNEQGKQNVVATYGPMTAMEARKTFKNAEGKGVLRDKVHVYSLHNGELVRFIIKGTGLWEKESELKNGKTEASRTPHKYFNNYFSTFAATEFFFRYEMKVDAVYRDHIINKYYRPIFTRGNQVSSDVEVKALKHLADLRQYFIEMDKATAEFVSNSTAPAVVISHEEDVDENGIPTF
jgi:hypothetical protein